MRVLIINSVCGIRSTGRICTDLADSLSCDGNEVRIAYGRETVPKQFQKYAVRIGSDLDVKWHGLESRLLDNHGLASRVATKRFLSWAEEYNPDLLWLHNIHGYYINYDLLFSWIKQRPQMEVRWTLHDCWAFTGHCAYFTMIKCQKWKNRCFNCIQKQRYPASLMIDNSKKNYEHKKATFTGVNNMVLITPSQWLADIVKQSFLKEYVVEVHKNKIDTSIFKPTLSNFRDSRRIKDKNLILGVASAWSERKGLDDFIRLSKMITSNDIIVLVGLTEKQMRGLPDNIIGIQRTNSPKELAEIYTAADVFVNPTYEDNYPTVNLEAEACGTRVVSYDTGGCRETLQREDSDVVKVGDVNAILDSINKRRVE